MTEEEHLSIFLTLTPCTKITFIGSLQCPWRHTILCSAGDQQRRQQQSQVWTHQERPGEGFRLQVALHPIAAASALPVHLLSASSPHAHLHTTIIRHYRDLAVSKNCCYSPATCERSKPRTQENFIASHNMNLHLLHHQGPGRWLLRLLQLPPQPARVGRWSQRSGCLQYPCCPAAAWPW